MIIRYKKIITGVTTVFELDTETGINTFRGVPQYPPFSALESWGWVDVDIVGDRLSAYLFVQDEATGNNFLRRVGAAAFGGSGVSVEVSRGQVEARVPTSWGYALLVGDALHPHAVTQAIRAVIPGAGGVSYNSYTLPSWLASMIAGGAQIEHIQCQRGMRLLAIGATEVAISTPIDTATAEWGLAGSISIPDIPEPSTEDEYRLRGAELARSIITAVRGLSDDVLDLPYLELSAGRSVYADAQNRSLVSGNDLVVCRLREVEELVAGEYVVVDTETWSWRISISGGTAEVLEHKASSLMDMLGEPTITMWMKIAATPFSNSPANFWTGFKLAAELR
ncbi:hypothetical protein LLE81_00345 [Staphylococcus epidermidis]|nr:hypothetical protein [Staphylococcus epidermidis]